MAVPSGNSHLKNTTGGSFVSQTFGGTLLGNQSTGSVITKSFPLTSNATEWNKGTLPAETANGIVANQKILSGGTFAYTSTGSYIIKTISTSISGVASTKLLIPASDVEGRRPIAMFEHDFGAKLLTKYRANQFTLTGKLNSGASNVSRLMWLNAAGNAAEAPATLSTTNMYDISDGDATDKAVDSAATPTRAIPGELVMKVDFVTTSVASGGDFFDYKPITGK